MTRNLELIRDLLLAIEADPECGAVKCLVKKGYSEEEIGFHCYLLGDAGYAKVEDSSTTEDSYPQAIPLNLTWKGYEFLDAARESDRWKKLKSALNRVGAASFEVVLDLLKDYAKKELGI